MRKPFSSPLFSLGIAGLLAAGIFSVGVLTSLQSLPVSAEAHRNSVRSLSGRADLAAGLYSAWIENADSGGAVMIVSPNAINDVAELIRFDGEILCSAALSRDGRRLAVVSQPLTGGKQTLWYADLSMGTRAPVGEDVSFDGLSWSPDGQLAFIRSAPSSTSSLSKDGTEATLPALVQVLAIWSPETGVTRTVVTASPAQHLVIAGWAADGKSVLYSLSASVSSSGKMMVQSSGGGEPGVSVSNEGFTGVASANSGGGTLLAGADDGVVAVSVDGSRRTVIAQPGIGFSAIWNARGDAVLATKWDSASQKIFLQSIDAMGGAAQIIREIAPVGEWRLLSASPDGLWVSGYQYYSGTYLISLASEDVLLLPVGGDAASFIGWIWITG